MISFILAQTRNFNAGAGEIVNDIPTIKGFEVVFENLVSIILGLVGIVLFVLLIVGGIKYITAGGDPKGIEEAKKTLTLAIAGVVLIALSYLILNLIGIITGAPLSVFKIFIP